MFEKSVGWIRTATCLIRVKIGDLEGVPTCGHNKPNPSSNIQKDHTIRVKDKISTSLDAFNFWIFKYLTSSFNGHNHVMDIQEREIYFNILALHF